MKILKRNGQEVDFDANEIKTRLSLLAIGLNIDVDYVFIAICKNMPDKITSQKLDLLGASVASEFKIKHPDYETFAARIFADNLHKITPKTFSAATRELFDHSRISAEYYKFVMKHREQLDAAICPEKDFLFTYFGLNKLVDTYLLRELPDADVWDKLTPDNFEEMLDNPEIATAIKNENAREKLGRLIETPQYMLMREAIGIHHSNPREHAPAELIAMILEVYAMLSDQLYTHATPTLFNAGRPNGNLLSCFLLGVNDNQPSILQLGSNAAIISRNSGGIGIHYHNIRGNGSIINSTGYPSGGIVPQIQILGAHARCWNQGGKRKGVMAIYLEPWHTDILEFLELKRPTGSPEKRCQDLTYALWVPDLFIKRVTEDGDWLLCSDKELPGLAEAFDETSESVGTTGSFSKLYLKYEKFVATTGRHGQIVKAKKIFDAICASLMESGGPYICMKDAANRKSNHANRGTIRSSNLCAEIYEYSDAKEYACCTLASINLKKFIRIDDNQNDTLNNNTVDNKNDTVNNNSVGNNSVDNNNKRSAKFDFALLDRTVRQIVNNLDIIIDVNSYPVPETRISNESMRPLGIGVQGLANLFMEMGIAFDSKEAEALDASIFRTIYLSAVDESANLAQKYGAYKHFAGSPASQGVLSPHLWGVHNDTAANELAIKVMKSGLRNSLLVALMPTVSTSEILGNEESFEPLESNIYSKSTLNGKILLFNKCLQNAFIARGLWDSQMYYKIEAARGSVQNIAEIPEDIRNVFKTVWEIPHKYIMNRAATRHAWVDQGMSLNAHISSLSPTTIKAILVHGYKLGLKTIIYYCRTRASTNAVGTSALSQKAAANKIDKLEPSQLHLSGVAKDSANAIVPTRYEPDSKLHSAEDEDVGYCKKEEGCITCTA